MTDDPDTLAVGSLMARSAALRPGRIQCASGTCRCPQRAHWYSAVALSQATERGTVKPQEEQATVTTWRSKRLGASGALVMAMSPATATLGKHIGGRADHQCAHSHDPAFVSAAGELDHRRRNVLGEASLVAAAREVCGRRFGRRCGTGHGRPPRAIPQARLVSPCIPTGFARGRSASPHPATAPPTGPPLLEQAVRAFRRCAVFLAPRAPIVGPALTGPGGSVLRRTAGP